MKTESFDLIVIGSGPAGEKGAAQVAYFGKRVAVVERARVVGGAGVNTGTLPSKTLRESALYLSGVRDRGLYGVERVLAHELEIDDLLYRLHHVVGSEQALVAENLERHRIALYHGNACFLDANCVEVTLNEGGTARLSAPVFLIATGSRPHRPAEVPFDDTRVHDSDTILSLPFLPRSLVVVGAGVIGSEYASIFATLGVRTTLLDGRAELLPHLDGEVSGLLQAAFQENLGMELRLGQSVAGYALRDDHVVVQLAGDASIHADALLFAGGRQGNTDGLGLEALGIEVNRRGQITVDEHYRTALPHIYAAGDVIGFPALAATSMEQARVAMCHAFGITYKERLSPLLPYGIYTVPEIGVVGETEESCRAKGIDYEVGRSRYRTNPRGQITGDLEGMVKIVFRPEDKSLLGAHVIGTNATEIIHLAAACMTLGGSLDYFIDSVFNYPSLTDAYKYAAYDGLGRLARRTLNPA